MDVGTYNVLAHTLQSTDVSITIGSKSHPEAKSKRFTVCKQCSAYGEKLKIEEARTENLVKNIFDLQSRRLFDTELLKMRTAYQFKFSLPYT